MIKKRYFHSYTQTNTSRQDTETQIAVLIAVAVSVFRVMMVLLWGGGHVCVSLLSDAWYKRSEEGKRQWHLEESVWVREGRGLSHLSADLCIVFCYVFVYIQMSGLRVVYCMCVSVATV